MPDSNTEQRKLAAIMFTDMVGFSALAQHNEALALELLEEHRQLLRPIFPRHQGREVKSTGDGFLVEFPSALAATQCALEIQKTVAGRNAAAGPERRFFLRIGVHLGDVVQREGDLFGDGVNIAARIEPLAEAGGICLSRPVVDQVSNKLEVRLEKLDTPKLKNIQMPVEVYRVVLPWQAEGAPRPKRQLRPPVDIRLVGAGIATLLLIALAGWFMFQKTGPSGGKASPIESLVVLPFKNLSKDADQEYFADGMTELLGSQLGKLGRLRKVIYSRQALTQYKERGGKSITDLARDFVVDGVVEGSVFREGGQVRILVSLIHGATQREVWSESYTRPMEGVLKLQSDVALAIAREIKLALSPEERARLAVTHEVNPAVIENYFRGRSYLEQWNRDGTLQAIKYFRAALQIQTNYAPAHAALVDCYIFADPGLPPKQANEEARRALAAAVAADENAVEVQAAVALVKYQVEWDWAGAEAAFQRAFAVNPNFAHGHHIYAHLLMTVGRTNEALIEGRRYLELAPRSPAAHRHLGSHYNALTRQYDLALKHVSNALQIDPGYAEAFYEKAFSYLQKGEFENAEAAAKKAIEISPGSQNYHARLAHVHAAWGKTNEARQELADIQAKARQQGEYFAVYDAALIHTALNDHDEALKWLRQSMTEEDRAWWIVELPITPSFDPLRADPRFKELLAQMKLPAR